MYLSYFGLSEPPFSIAPSPRYLYMSQRHQEALAHLLYGIHGDGGFVLLTGEVGTGKTTICRGLLEQIPEGCDVAYIFNPKLTVEELLSTICAEFGIKCPKRNVSVKMYVDRINEHLLETHAQGGRAVLIIDEAQNLSADVLEQMRLLTNLETDERKLLQIILLGQPELGQLLGSPVLRQVSQRIIARYHLSPLNKDEVAAYIQHRLEVAGAQRPLFPQALMGRIYRLSGGVPRVINLLCDRALLGAFVQGKERVDAKILDRAAKEVLDRPRGFRLDWRWAGASVGMALAGAALAVWLMRMEGPAQSPPLNTPSAQIEPVAVAAKEKEITPVVAPQTTTPQTPAAAPAPLQWPANQPMSNTKRLAEAALLRAWGINSQGGDLCRHAEARGLACRTSRGGLEELRQLNLPAILVLHDPSGREFHALLTGLGPGSATFELGKAAGTVSLAALPSQWSGGYTLLWPRPQQVRDTIRPGDDGPPVAWLRAQLAYIRGEAEVKHPEAGFDDALLAQVKAFQRAQGLVADGSVGAETLVRLVSLGGQAMPRLMRAGG